MLRGNKIMKSDKRESFHHAVCFMQVLIYMGGKNEKHSSMQLSTPNLHKSKAFLFHKGKQDFNSQS